MSTFAAIQESLKEFSLEELLSITAAANAEAKKKAKAPKEKAKKTGSMPKGEVPPQLRIPHAWVKFTLDHANKNGWESFQVAQGELQPASVKKEGVHVFEATGKPMNHKQAMSLSKQRWAAKTKTGTHEAMYAQFLAQFHAADVSVEFEEKKEAESSVPVKEKAKAKVTSVSTTSENWATPVAKEAKAPKVPKAKAEKWTCPDDGAVHPWEFEGKKYARNHQNQVWSVTAEGELGVWAGEFDGKKIDTSKSEPLYVDEE